ncbi:MAG TPA: putative baseplate assembly protein, partial [Longimicrobiaceae bacterium]|nr:putative baseplate assembly protein [Longimicrobiaceae bacterium]
RFAGTGGGGVFRLRAGESAWTPASNGLDNLDVTALARGEDGTLFAGTLGGGVFRSADAGESWLPARGGLRVPQVQALLATPEGDLFAGTCGGGVFRSADGGVSWTPDESGAANDILALAVDRDGRVLAGADDASLLLSPDGSRHERLGVQGLFTLGVAPDVLDGGAVSEGVRREFREQGIALGTTAALRVRVAGSVWELEDGDALYSLHREGDRVEVYRPRDLLLALAAPTPVVEGVFRVEARCTDGFEGWLHARPDELVWRPVAVDDDPVGEVAVAAVSAPSDDGTSTTVELAEPLRNVYDPRTVTLCANVAHATHGATVDEVLGSGNASLANQSFVLRRAPLTYTRSRDAAGTASTLVVRVNGVRWTEVPSLHDQDSLARCYQVTHTQDGRCIVTFGDGKNGARLPTGTENVSATYRVGTGVAGNVDAGALRLLRTPAVGVRRVNNPVPATGGAAPETPEEARRRAPVRACTLHRIVSLRDYGDFARTYPGVARALVGEVWDGREMRLHLTVDPADGGELDRGSELCRGLVASIRAASLAPRPFTVEGPEELRFRLEAGVRFDSRYRETDVEAAVRGALAARFARERREFGEEVAESEVIAVVQGVAGVVSVELQALHPSGSTPALLPVLRAELARWDAEAGEVRLAQILVLDPAAGVSLRLRDAP